jgi:hypothetical protein
LFGQVLEDIKKMGRKWQEIKKEESWEERGNRREQMQLHSSLAKKKKGKAVPVTGCEGP